MELLDGKAISAEIKLELKQKVDQRKNTGKKIPHLAAVLVGSNGASMTYVSAKVKACQEIGFESSLIEYGAEITEGELLEKISALNSDSNIDGFIVQLPLPAHIDEMKITQAIDPLKDVDGFHPSNLGNMVLNLPGFLPATPSGVMEMIKRKNIPTEGKHCVILGRSHIVGLPLSIMLGKNSNPGNCTVTLVHSRSKGLVDLCRQADILIAAVGRPGFVTKDMVKPGAVVIDVGTTRIDDPTRERGWRLVGDVDFEGVAPISSLITPVPGGVGPMTIASLMINTLRALELQGK